MVRLFPIITMMRFGRRFSLGSLSLSRFGFSSIKRDDDDDDVLFVVCFQGMICVYGC